MSTAAAPDSTGTATSAAASAVHPVLIGGGWRPAASVETFTAANPRTRQALDDRYPVSAWPDADAALDAAVLAAAALRSLPDAGETIAGFLEAYAVAIEANSASLVAAAALETGLPVSPRLAAVELPRTTSQLRQAALAAREGSWLRPVIDTQSGLRSCLAPIGPVWTIGPNNFPFAYNGIAGGDFAAAMAGGNPVIAKAHPLHPTTTRLLAELAHVAAQNSGLPVGTIQMLYHLSPADGLRMAQDARLSAIGFTGSRAGGMTLKAAADSAGTLFFGEMSSINPTIILPGALVERSDAIVDQWSTSLLMGCGQFCTKPGLVVLLAGEASEQFISKTAAKLADAPAGVLFSAAGESSLSAAIKTLLSAGAEVVTDISPITAGAFSLPNTLLRTTAARFLEQPKTFQTEAFGSAAVLVVADDAGQLHAVLRALEGNLTGSIYSSSSDADNALYDKAAAVLRPKVGRLLNDKMPTGVAVSPAMNHGGPWPVTSQPHFTAVGMPAAILRFTQLESYDNVREHRLPPCLRGTNPTGRMWRQIDGNWTQANI